MNTNEGCSDDDDDEVLLVAAPPDVALPELPARSKGQGTGTNFSAPALEDEVAAGLAVLLLVELLDDAPDVALELIWITAKSIRPELGLIITSLMVPRLDPDELDTVAPINWLPRTCC